MINEPDAGKAWKMVRDFEPRAYMVNYLALEKAMSITKKVKILHPERERPKGRFRVPQIIRLWIERYVIQRKWTGRPRSLVIMRDPIVGKSAYAESQGNPIVMNSG